MSKTENSYQKFQFLRTNNFNKHIHWQRIYRYQIATRLIYANVTPSIK